VVGLDGLSVAGGLAEIYWGYSGIPADWLHDMRGHEIVEPMIARLLAMPR